MRKTLFMLVLLVACNAIYAQESNKELIGKLVEKNILTQAEADSLLQQSNPDNIRFTDKVEKVRNAFNTPYMSFGGYGLLLYEYNNTKDVKHSADPRVLFLWMRGEPIKNFKYYVLYEFVNPLPYEYYIDWTPSTAFNIRLGQAKTPMSLENQLSLTVLESIRNTRSTAALMGMTGDVLQLQNGRNNGGRDMGIQFYGQLFNMKTHNLLQYGVGVYQGTGIKTSETNNAKDLAANILFQPIKGFRIGGGGYFGQATYLKPDGSEIADHVRNRWIISSDYKSERVYARAEWIYANDGGIKKTGAHLMGLYYFIPTKLNAFAKVDYLEGNEKLNEDVTDWTIGTNYYFYPSCRVQLNYTYSDYSDNTRKNSHVVAAQLQIVF